MQETLSYLCSKTSAEEMDQILILNLRVMLIQ